MMMIRQNIIHNFPVTVEDIEIGGNVFGPDVPSLKGKNNETNAKSGCGLFYLDTKRTD